MILTTLFLIQCLHADSLLRVKPHLIVPPSSPINLNQFIDSKSLEASSLKDLEKIQVAKAPALGERLEISKASLLELLKPVMQKQRELKQAETLHLVLPETVLVETLRRDLTSDTVKAEMLQAWQPLCLDCQLEIEGLSVPQVTQYRDWNLHFKPDLPRSSFSVSLQVIRENGSSQSLWVSGRLITKRKVPVTTRMMSPQERIQPEDIKWDYRDTSFSIDGIPTESEIVGKRLKMAVRANDVIWRGQIEKEKAIKRGDLVLIKAGPGAWEVSLSVIAEQDAFVGDTIKFKNPKTNTLLVGQVIGQGEVELR